ncbi:MAG: hypothetical protein KDC39_02745 [Actinobacteria bacterium]|nr:hypothetical protein [Actinomycetota bacterium]
MIVAVFRRRLREGSTYADFLREQEDDPGFSVPTRVFNSVNLSNDREIFTLAFLPVTPKELAEGQTILAEEIANRVQRISQVVESVEYENIFEVHTELDFSQGPIEISVGGSDSLLGPLEVMRESMERQGRFLL